ncbi:hypothetical protein KP004_03695 [Geomonas oryzisoli]|uniref:MFS transporter n=1 Tax=Geomonas oryzisoli TaxID=2847992 RepID=A0ABX8JC90_9BACT|nr:hypothetical protein [Geomonas oryzisoli]QWV94299.1 hypothetical protein KP004_03695 [Geomonas oryzisoli]
MSETDKAKGADLCRECEAKVFEKDGSQREEMARPADSAGKKKEIWWVVSVGSLLGFTGIGFLTCFLLPRSESDWFGIRYLLVIGGAGLVGCLLCVIFAIISLNRREKRSLWAVGAAFPSSLILMVCFTFAMNQHAKQENYQNWATSYKNYKQEIIANPEIVLSEHWATTADATKETAFRESFGDPAVYYDLRLLKRIYNEVPRMREYVFLHPACDREFIEEHFDEAFKRAEKVNYTMLASMMKNPNTPIELVEKVASSKGMVMGAVEPARYALQKRKGGNEDGQ